MCSLGAPFEFCISGLQIVDEFDAGPRFDTDGAYLLVDVRGCFNGHLFVHTFTMYVHPECCS